MVWKSRVQTKDAMGANKDPRKPPLCKTVFFYWRLMDFLARVLKPALLLLSLVFYVWVFSKNVVRTLTQTLYQTSVGFGDNLLTDARFGFL